MANNMYRRQIGFIARGGGVNFQALVNEEKLKAGRTVRVTSDGAEIFDEKFSAK